MSYQTTPFGIDVCAVKPTQKRTRIGAKCTHQRPTLVFSPCPVMLIQITNKKRPEILFKTRQRQGYREKTTKEQKNIQKKVPNYTWDGTGEEFINERKIWASAGVRKNACAVRKQATNPRKKRTDCVLLQWGAVSCDPRSCLCHCSSKGS